MPNDTPTPAPQTTAATPTVQPDGGPLGHSAMGALAGATKAAWSEGLTAPAPAAPTAPSWSEGLTPAPTARQGMGAAALGSPEDIGTGPEGTTDINRLMSPASQEEASRGGAIVAGGLAGTLAAPFAAAAAGGGLLGSVAAGGAAGGTQAVVQQVGQGENPFRVKNLINTAEETAAGAAGGAVLHGAGKAVQAVKNAIAPEEIGDVTAGMFKKVNVPKFQHGVPSEVEAPFDRATINNLPRGKNLTEGAATKLQEYVGDTIPRGSSPENQLVKAVEPVQKAITETGTAMNKVIDAAGPFKTSILEDAAPKYTLAKVGEESAPTQSWHPEVQKTSYMSPEEYLEQAGEKNISRPKVEALKEKMQSGTPLDPPWLDRNVETGNITNQEGRHRAVAARELGIQKIPVVEFQRGPKGTYIPTENPTPFVNTENKSSSFINDVNDLRDNLPLKLDDPLNKVIDKQMEGAYDVLNSTDPHEVLAYRRKLGQQIDWNNLVEHPDPASEVANMTRVKIYDALGTKIHAEIPETVPLDAEFQPNLELRDYMDKTLGKAISRNVPEANAQHLSEFKKGQNVLQAQAHNAKVDRNLKIALRLGAVGAGGALYEAGATGVKHAAQP